MAAENQEQPIRTNQPPQESSDSPALSKVETLKLLNDSIDKLEATIKGISEDDADNLPSSSSINDLVATTQELANTVAPTPPALPTVDSTSSTKPSIKPASVAVSKPPAKIAKVPTAPEPKPKQNKVVLISIGVFAIALAAIAVFWIWFPQTQTSLDAVSSEPAIVGDDIARSIPETMTTIEEETIEVREDLDTSSNVEPETPTEISIPQNLIAPSKAQNLKMVTIEPELTFTPEQKLVAALQTKLGKLTEGYPTEFIELIKVDPQQNSILVEVNDEWYGLNESRQNKVGNAILERSRQLKFDRLKFQDSTGTLVARNPVVGDKIIILETVKNNG